ncbi:PREDICTED: CBS domain-containing protein CBSX5-like [Nelumbo nucifera]|uniref:CBS domain-containing protein CBSX5-like n=1 Tax=Nelumbo nucifera TaxID=4432 RepID=A0A1U7YPN3_NELNU|nr:PREDICTED: CBS domain-containing protein CBSX5-like [Nelumbo nucifera]
MAVSLLGHEVSDLCLGKPALRSLSISATIGDALSVLKSSEENYLSLWSCDHSSKPKVDFEDCRCIGKICMVDVICFLCKEENLACPSSALKSPISVLLPKAAGIVRHVEPHFSLLDAIRLILEGAQNLIVPIQSSISNNSRKKLLQKSSFGPTLHNGREFCWLTQEDVIRFLLSSIGLFSPIAALSVESLGIISTEVLAVGYHDPAYSAVDLISSSLSQQTSVAVVDDDGKLIGEISPFTLASCDETVAAAIRTLSAGDLMAYIDCGGPPDDLVRVVKARLKERKLEGMLELLEEFSVSSTSSSSSMSSSSDEEFASSPTAPLRSRRYSRSGSYSARMVRRAEAIVCHPGSSLVAVMIQALAHRVNYVWVIEDDYSLAGIVTFSEMLDVFGDYLESME